MKNYDSIELTGRDDDYKRIIRHQQMQVDELQKSINAQTTKLDESIKSSEELLHSLGIETHRPSYREDNKRQTIVTRNFDEILADAKESVPDNVSLDSIITPEEISRAEADVASVINKYNLEHKLDPLDWGIAGVAGTLAALVDIFLVKMPFGLKSPEGGVLSNAIRNKLKNLYSPEKIRKLEKLFAVPYDASTSQKLSKYVEGLNPRTHRFQSLGHDPVLGFIFGVKDIILGQFTAIDKAGKIIVQNIPGADQGIGLFQAIITQIGHLKSDIGSTAGLPAPFMPLFQLLQMGNIKGRTIGEISRLMYVQGYDFGHFLAMGVPVMMIEVIVRLFYFLKRIHEGHTWEESIPVNIGRKFKLPKLQTMLFTAHTISTAINAGKVYFTAGMGNPFLALNLPQWQMFALNSYRQLKWVLIEKDEERNKLVQEMLDEHWDNINNTLLEKWDIVTC